jgi:hypothetical protein
VLSGHLYPQLTYGTKDGVKVTLAGPQSLPGLCVKEEIVISGGSPIEVTEA